MSHSHMYSDAASRMYADAVNSMAFSTNASEKRLKRALVHCKVADRSAVKDLPKLLQSYGC